IRVISPGADEKIARLERWWILVSRQILFVRGQLADACDDVKTGIVQGRSAPANDVGCLVLNAPCVDGLLLVPIAINIDPPLLFEHAAMVLFGIVCIRSEDHTSELQSRYHPEWCLPF